MRCGVIPGFLTVLSMACLWGQPAAESASILEPGRGWELLGEGFQLTADATADSEGVVYFTDAQKNRILKVGLDGRITVWKENSGGTHGVAIGADGRLYGAQQSRGRIIVYSPDGQETLLADGAPTHHLTVIGQKGVYYSDGPNHRVWLLDAAGQKRVVTSEMNWPHGLCVSADKSALIVTDSRDGSVWSFPIQADGSLAKGSPFFHLRIPGNRADIDAGGVTMDTKGYVYVATKIGVQVCDRTGEVVEVVGAPGKEGVNNVLFAGPDRQWLYVSDGERLFRRPVERRGAAQ